MSCRQFSFGHVSLAVVWYELRKERIVSLSPCQLKNKTVFCLNKIKLTEITRIYGDFQKSKNVCNRSKHLISPKTERCLKIKPRERRHVLFSISRSKAQLFSCNKMNPDVGDVKSVKLRYLSAMLAGLTLSMTMTCLLQNMEVDRATPRLEPVGLATSTSSGPDAVATESADAETNTLEPRLHYFLLLFGVPQGSCHVTLKFTVVFKTLLMIQIMQVIHTFTNCCFMSSKLLNFEYFIRCVGLSLCQK